MSENAIKSSQTLDQRRGRHAWKCIEEVKQFPSDKHKEEYAREAKKLPTRIMAAGLGQALAFLLAKAKGKSERPKEHLKKLHDDLTAWLNERPLVLKKRDSLLESIIHDSSDFVRLATDEVLAYLQWLNRFSEAELNFSLNEVESEG